MNTEAKKRANLRRIEALPEVDDVALLVVDEVRVQQHKRVARVELPVALHRPRSELKVLDAPDLELALAVVGHDVCLALRRAVHRLGVKGLLLELLALGLDLQPLDRLLLHPPGKVLLEQRGLALLDHARHGCGVGVSATVSSKEKKMSRGQLHKEKAFVTCGLTLSAQ